MDGPWYQMSSPTSQDVKDILLKKGYSKWAAEAAMAHVNHEFGSWYGLNVFTMPKMIKFINGMQEIRQIGNGC